jgi:hypothetical protein
MNRSLQTASNHVIVLHTLLECRYKGETVEDLTIYLNYFDNFTCSRPNDANKCA